MLFTYVKADVTGNTQVSDTKNGFATIHYLGHLSAASSSKTCSDVNNLLDIAVALLYNDRNDHYGVMIRLLHSRRRFSHLESGDESKNSAKLGDTW